MAITTMDGLVNAALNTSQRHFFYKNNFTTTLTGYISSLWTAVGMPWAGVAPTSVATCTKDTQGALAPITNAVSGNNYLFNLAIASGTAAGMYMIHDRLSHNGGLDANSTSLQSFSHTIPSGRDAATDGSDVEWYIEIYTIIGTTSRSVTVTYTDQTDTSRTCTVAIGNTNFREVGRVIRIIPNDGQYIKSIESVQITVGGTGATGNFGITCVRPIVRVQSGPQYGGLVHGFAALGLPKLPSNVCLAIHYLASTTSLATPLGSLTVVGG